MASKRRLRRKMCGKKPYSSTEKANKDRWPNRMDLRAYTCPFCGRVHLGHPTRGRRLSDAAKARARREGR